MDGISIALSFLVFGFVEGVGVFLVIANVRAFVMGIRSHRTMSTPDLGGVGSFSMGEITAGMLNIVMALLGVGLFLQGLLWPYIMVFR